jgi:PAS domain S-box-containing protein
MEPGSNERSVLPLKWSLLLFALLTAMGLAGNYFRYEIFFNIQFVFGSIFAFLVLQCLGLRLGIAAAFLISLMTFRLWNHPYAIVIMTAEVAVVGLLQKRRQFGLVLADAIYWLVIGIPLVILFYFGVMRLPFASVEVTLMKQVLNGVANVLVARLLFMAVMYWRRLGLFSLRELIFNLLALFVLLPSLLMMALQSHHDLERTERNARTSLQLAEQRMAPAIENWLHSHINGMEHLAWMAAMQPPAMVQHSLEQMRLSDRDYLRLGLLDSSATSIAYSPLVDELGTKNIGRNFADRPFFSILKRTLKPMLSEVAMARVGVPKPRVMVVAPVMKQGEFAGFVIGVLDMAKVREMIELNIRSSSLPKVQYVLLDMQGKVIISSRQEVKPLEPYRRSGGELIALGGGISQWLPDNVRNVSVSDRWMKALYVSESGIGENTQWRLILEQPLQPFQKELYERYATRLAWLFAILLAALAVGEVASRQFVGTLEEVRTISTDIPDRIASGEKIRWPESAILETKKLIDNFRAMAQELVRQFGAIQGLNAELERRVEERTRELQESVENYRQLFEAESDAIVLIENASGRILKANQAASTMYGYEPEELLSMRNTDLSAEAEQTRKVTRETPPAPDTVITIPLRLHRKKDGTVFPVEITGRFFLQGGQAVHIAAIRDITRRTRMEQSLRESEERFRSLFEKVPVVALVIDPADGSIIDANTAATHFYGWSHDQLLGMNISEINTLPADEIKQEMEAARYGNRSSFHFLHRLADGSIRDVEVFSGPVTVGGRGVLYSIIHDITERRQAEAEREQFHKFFQTSADLMAMADSNGVFFKINPAFTDTLGYTETELLDRPYIDFVHPEDRQATREEMARQQQEGYTLNFENRYLCKDGSVRWMAWRAIFNADEGITYATARDISEQKQVSEELRRLANEQEIILNTIAIGIIHVKERRLIWSNPAYRRLFGFTMPECADLPARQIYATEAEYERVGREGYAKLAAGEVYHTEVRSMRKDGSQFWLNLSGVAVNPSQPEEGSIWMLEDISERKAMEIALHEREKFLRTIIDSEPDCIKLLNADGSVIMMNPAGLAMLDAESLAQVQGQSIYPLIVPEHREVFKKLTEEVYRGHTGTLEFEAVGLQGRHVWLETHTVPLYNDRDEIIAVLGITRDVTTRRQEEEALRELTRTLELRVEEEIGRRLKNEQMLVQQAKLAAMGEMLGAIAHQWRQPLNTLALCVQNINEAFIHEELDRAYLDRTVGKSMDQIRHMSKTIDDFRNFFQPDKERSLFDTMGAVGEVLSLLSAQLTSNDIAFRLTCHTHGKSFEVVADIASCPEKMVDGFKNEFEHVILNLISNAKDAIAARREGLPGAGSGRGLITFDFFNRGGGLVIEVGDNGTGIPATILPRIFEPYYTTKEQAKGTGIGLYMSRIIIEDHMHGTLTAENRDQGAVFTITIPQTGERGAA